MELGYLFTNMVIHNIRLQWLLFVLLKNGLEPLFVVASSFFSQLAVAGSSRHEETLVRIRLTQNV